MTTTAMMMLRRVCDGGEPQQVLTDQTPPIVLAS
jgi:hypothetical protein